MRTQYRVILLILGLLLLAGLGLTLVSRSEKNHAALLYQDVVDQHQHLFNAVYRLDGESQANLAKDYSYWDDMVNFVKNPTTKPSQTFAQQNLNVALDTYHVDAIWVFDSAGKEIYQTNALDQSSFKLPLDPTQLNQAFSRQKLTHFYVRTSQGIVELRGATIHPSDDPTRQSVSSGYFFVGRLYGLGYRQSLSANLKSEVDIAPTLPENLPAPNTGQIILSEPLKGLDGQPISYLQVTADAPSIRDIYQLSSKRLENFAAIVLPLVLLLFWFLTRYVTAPLNLISATLKSHDPTALDKLEIKKNEFGQIAALLGDYFRQNRIQLSEAHSRLRAAINAINIGFVMTDVNKNVMIVNDAARQILFDDPKRSREITLEELDQLMPKQQLIRTVDNTMQTFSNHGLGEVQLKGKILRIFVAPVTEVVAKPPVLGSIILIEDVTMAKGLARARDEFFSIASHELRTPLTVIMGNSSIILDHILPKIKDPELTEMTKDIFDSSQRLIQMVNDFLDTSRLEQDRIKFELSDFDLEAMIEAVIKEYHNVAKTENIELKYERMKGDNINAFVRADQSKLQQVLINLLSNAVTFTHEGSVTFRLEAHPEYIRTFVTDTGEGIPEERQHLLFKKFQQAEENILSRNAARTLSPGSARDTTHGTGLGLYISKMLMEGMGGIIRLESSEAGKGTTFSLTLPSAGANRVSKGGQDGK